MSRTIIKVQKLVINQEVSSPMIFIFMKDRFREGRLEVYKRSLTWYPKYSHQGYTISIDKIDEAFQEYGRKRRKRK